MKVIRHHGSISAPKEKNIKVISQVITGYYLGKEHKVSRSSILYYTDEHMDNPSEHNVEQIAHYLISLLYEMVDNARTPHHIGVDLSSKVMKDIFRLVKWKNYPFEKNVQIVVDYINSNKSAVQSLITTDYNVVLKERRKSIAQSIIDKNNKIRLEKEEQENLRNTKNEAIMKIDYYFRSIHSPSLKVNLDEIPTDEDYILAGRDNPKYHPKYEPKPLSVYSKPTLTLKNK